MAKTKIILALIALGLCVCPAFGIINQSFEVPTTDYGYTFPFGWESVYGGMVGLAPEADPAPRVIYHQNDAANAHSGNSYIEFNNLTGSDNWNVLYPHIGNEGAVDPNQLLNVSLWCKRSSGATAGEIGIKLECYSEAGQQFPFNKGIYSFNATFTADNTWEEIVVTDWAVPADVYYIRFVIAFYGKGTYYFDDYTSSVDVPEAYAPVPRDGSTVGYTITDEVSWGNPELSAPGETITQTVYFADVTNNDPNVIIDSGVGLSSATLPALADLHDYHWRVDCYDSGTGETTVGNWWNFSTGDSPPVLDMQWSYVWLDTDTNSDQIADQVDVMLNENGQIIDDGKSPMTINWDIISADSANTGVTWLDPNSVENPTVRFYATGDFEFSVTAADAQSEVSDTLHIIVYDSACSAAKGDPADAPLSGDVDEDCDVDIEDLKIIAGNWLECMSSELNGLVPSCP